MSYNQATENLICKACHGKINIGEWYEEKKGKFYHLDCSSLDQELPYSEYEESAKEYRRRQRREERAEKARLLGYE